MPTFARELAAAEAVERQKAAVESIPAPDLSALALKLRIALAGLPAASALIADVRRPAGRLDA